MSEVSNYDLALGEALRDDGIARAMRCENKLKVFSIASDIAIELGLRGGIICIDDVREEMERRGIEHRLLGPAAGALFKRGHNWRHCGYRRSSRVSSHARLVSLWRLVIM